MADRKKTLLIADDDDTIRYLLMEMLRDRFDILMVQNGKQLCALLNRCEDDFDLVIVDIHMPAWGADTLDPTKAINSTVFSADLQLRGSHLPVIYISGDKTKEYAIHKPIRGEELFAAIDKALAEHDG